MDFWFNLDPNHRTIETLVKQSKTESKPKSTTEQVYFPSFTAFQSLAENWIKSWKAPSSWPFILFCCFLSLLTRLSETQFVPSAYKGYLVAKVLRSERAVNTDQLWHDVGVPSLIGKSKSMNNSPSWKIDLFWNRNDCGYLADHYLCLGRILLPKIYWKQRLFYLWLLLG